MITILSVAGVLLLIYFLARPEPKPKQPARRFGEGLLQDYNNIHINKYL